MAEGTEGREGSRGDRGRGRCKGVRGKGEVGLWVGEYGVGVDRGRGGGRLGGNGCKGMEAWKP